MTSREAINRFIDAADDLLAAQQADLMRHAGVSAENVALAEASMQLRSELLFAISDKATNRKVRKRA